MVLARKAHSLLSNTSWLLLPALSCDKVFHCLNTTMKDWTDSLTVTSLWVRLFTHPSINCYNYNYCFPCILRLSIRDYLLFSVCTIIRDCLIIFRS